MSLLLKSLVVTRDAGISTAPVAAGPSLPEAAGAVDIPYSCRHPVIRFVRPIVRQQRPDRPGILVGQSNRRHVLVASCQQLAQPRIGLRLSLCHPDDGPGPVDQQRAQIRVAALADAQQRRLAAGGMLLRHNAQPRSQLPAVSETPGIAHGRHQSARRHWADARNLR